MRYFITVVTAFLLALTLSSCGLKGPLYHPSEQDSSTNNNSINNSSSNSYSSAHNTSSLTE